MVFKIKYTNCRHNFGRIRSAARFEGSAWQNTFIGVKICSYHMFKTNFSEHNKIWEGTVKIWG